MKKGDKNKNKKAKPRWVERLSLFSGIFGIYIYLFLLVYTIIFRKYFLAFITIILFMLSIIYAYNYLREVFSDEYGIKRTFPDKIPTIEPKVQ